MKKVAFLQPHIPHYREEFFTKISSHSKTDIICYDLKASKKRYFDAAKLEVISIKNWQLGPALFYDPFSLFRKEYKTLVLMLHFGHLGTWFLLFTKFIHRKRIILWGQGISVKRYLKEEIQPDFLLRWMLSLADGAWTYTEKEAEQWQVIFPRKPIIALNNTISCVEQILNFKHSETKEKLKERYGIMQKTCFIFCARFTNNYRRIDLMLAMINKLDPQEYGFIIIGDGPAKPDFNLFENVYDFGSTYNQSLKDDLFTIADLYLQPGWVGLSVVEALAYGKPVLTFKRSPEVLQCVEYSYLTHGYNAILFNDLPDALKQIENLTIEQRGQMSKNARNYVQANLMMDHMVSQALKTL
ncbi:glycosyltransferase [Draconibacterium sp. IB214405]|uniref:glycosyltransferase n=1 Tax=Draconibacterium sp. IB214405 TaxID=3097352 RepID=UPI002A0C2C1F|nr:glycosyltransferase [Draconibacterium sp. IB214405]MDX8339293.1 glycosyltransferase [Draconibacterium sp. IB214405]